MSPAAAVRILNGRFGYFFARESPEAHGLHFLERRLDVTFPADLKATSALSRSRRDCSVISTSISTSAPQTNRRMGRGPRGKYPCQDRQGRPRPHQRRRPRIAIYKTSSASTSQIRGRLPVIPHAASVSTTNVFVGLTTREPRKYQAGYSTS